MKIITILAMFFVGCSHGNSETPEISTHKYLDASHVWSFAAREVVLKAERDCLVGHVKDGISFELVFPKGYSLIRDTSNRGFGLTDSKGRSIGSLGAKILIRGSEVIAKGDRRLEGVAFANGCGQLPIILVKPSIDEMQGVMPPIPAR